MKTGFIFSSVVLFLSVILPGCQTVSTDYKTFDLQVKEQLPDMIWMLEQGKTDEFIEKYISVQLIEQEGGITAMRTAFTPGATERLIAVLKLAQGMSPTIDRSTLTVTFSSAEFSPPLVLRKSLEVWRILSM